MCEGEPDPAMRYRARMARRHSIARHGAAVLLAAACILGACLHRAAAEKTAFEQSVNYFAEKYADNISDHAARNAITLAQSKLRNAACGTDAACLSANTEELPFPPVTVEQARAAMLFAATSAFAEWCGVDWRTNFDRQVKFWQLMSSLNSRHLQVMTAIHDARRDEQRAAFTKGSSCPPRVRERLEQLSTRN